MSTILLEGASLIEEDSSFEFMFVPVTLSEPSDDTIFVPYRAFSGTASSQIEFDYAAGTLRFDPGETTQNIRLNVYGDILAESDESIVIELAEPPNAELFGGGRTLSTVGWVIDDDRTFDDPSLWISDPYFEEGNSGTTRVTFELQLSRLAATDLEIPYEIVSHTARAGEDFVAQSGTVTIPGGGQTAFVDIDVLGDTISESNETLQLLLDLPLGVADAIGGQATILDDDRNAPLIFAEGDRVEEEDSNFDFAYFSVYLSEPAEERITVDYRVIGGTADSQNDFDATSGTLRFDPGESLATVRFNYRGDQTAEFDESVILELSSPVGAVLPGGTTRTETASWILDDDGVNPLSAFVSDPFVREGDGGSRTANYTVELSRPAPFDIEIPFTTSSRTAEAGVDFDASGGTVLFSRGARESTAGVEIFGDMEPESLETVDLQLNLSGLIAQLVIGQATLIDNDGEDRAIITTVEAQVIAYLYEAGLDRNGVIDLPGLNFWIDQYEAGLSLEQISQFFLDSPEFEAAFGDPDTLSDRELVQQLYRNVLDREGEEGGVNFWTTVVGMDNYGRDQLLLDFARSPENVLGSPQVELLALETPGEWAFLG